MDVSFKLIRFVVIPYITYINLICIHVQLYCPHSALFLQSALILSFYIDVVSILSINMFVKSMFMIIPLLLLSNSCWEILCVCGWGGGGGGGGGGGVVGVYQTDCF